MYNQSYDDYIRSVLGYPTANSQDYFQNYNSYNYNELDMYDNGQNRNEELEDCYPEIYKIVYPMVQKRCKNIESPITKEKIDIIVEELYSNIEEKRQTKNSQTENNITENRGMKEKRETRQFNNSGIMDIIRILLLRELLGRPNRPNNRPPFPPPPGRPPFPPNRPGRPTYYREYGDIYEY